MDYSEGFIRFWKAYPARREAKPNCFTKWKLYKLEPRTDEIITLLERFKLSDQWAKPYTYVPTIHKWLYAQPWEGCDIPPATKHDLEQHAGRLAENTGTTSELTRKIEDAMHERAATEWNKIDGEWGKMNAAEKRQVFVDYTQTTGFKAHIKPVQAWWWKKAK